VTEQRVRRRIQISGRNSTQLNSLMCADAPLRNYSLTHSRPVGSGHTSSL